MRKPRSDCKIANLPPLRRERAEEMLLTGCSYESVQTYLAEDGVRIAITNIRDYYQNHLILRKLARDNQVAEQFDKVESGSLDSATFAAIKAIAFDLSTSPKPDVKAISALGNLILKNRSLDHDDRKLRLLETRAAKADEAETVAQSTELTPEEKERKIRDIFGLA